MPEELQVLALVVALAVIVIGGTVRLVRFVWYQGRSEPAGEVERLRDEVARLTAEVETLRQRR